MIDTPQTIFRAIPSNKFHPPRLNRRQTIDRHTIIARRLPKPLCSNTFIIVEAQSGQGKTTLVQQFLDESGIPAIWYQIGSEDADPAVFVSSLLLAFSLTFPDVFHVRLSGSLESGIISSTDFRRDINMLFNYVGRQWKGDLFLVFEDLHLLETTSSSRHLLDYVFDTAPRQLHFILTSRHPVQQQAKALRTSPHLVYLDNDDLMFLPTEIEQLYDCLHATPLSHDEALDIFAVTNGWIMGIVLVSHPLSKKRGEVRFHRTPTADEFVLDYFSDEVFAWIPEQIHSMLLRLSFLEEIDVPIAAELVSMDDLQQKLDELADKNFFVYRLDHENHVYRLHHLFQEFLQATGKRILGQAMISDLCRLAGQCYLKHNMVDKALKIMRKNNDFATMEAVLRRRGLYLVANNSTAQVLSLLRTIPPSVQPDYPWLMFFHGLLTAENSPRKSLPLLRSCWKRFRDSGDQVGELMATTQLVSHHVIVSGNFSTGRKLLERMQVLFEEVGSVLPNEFSFLVARSLASGLCIFCGDTAVARHYALRSYSLAQAHGSSNFIAAAEFTIGHIELLCGNRRLARRHLENIHALTWNKMIGALNRLLIQFLQLYHLSKYGNFTVFEHYRNILLADFSREELNQTVVGAYQSLWHAIAMIDQGRPDNAAGIIDQAMKSGAVVGDHMISQFLQWRSLTEALRGMEVAALCSIEKASQLRARNQGPFHEANHRAVKGIVLTILHRDEEAEKELTAARRISMGLPSGTVFVCCLAYQALIELCRGNLPVARKTLAAWLSALKKHGYDYFWGWESGSMIHLLSAAVKLGIETKTARHLARDRLDLHIDNQGKVTPLLAVNVLGSMRISLGNQYLFGPSDFNVHQRDLLALLAISPDQRVNQEQVQLLFWPDSTPEKARNSFDALMSRLRKILSGKLQVPPARYICVEKGFVCLNNATIDICRFFAHARRGIRLSREEQWWQAGNEFIAALSLWSVFRPNTDFGTDTILASLDEAVTVLQSVCITWCTRLAEMNRGEEALSILAKTEHFLPPDEELVALRYRLLIGLQRPLQARELLAAYRRKLVDLGYDIEEADAAVSCLVTRNS